MLCGVELDAVERALHDRGHEIALILAKLAGFSSTTAKAILLLKTADRGISAQDLDNALRTYEKLQLDTARRVLGFYRTRLKSRGSSAVARRRRLSVAATRGAERAGATRRSRAGSYQELRRADCPRPTRSPGTAPCDR